MFSSSVVLHHVVECLLELVVDGLALLLLPDELVLELVDLQVDSLHVHLAVLGAALSVLGTNHVKLKLGDGAVGNRPILSVLNLLASPQFTLA